MSLLSSERDQTPILLGSRKANPTQPKAALGFQEAFFRSESQGSQPTGDGEAVQRGQPQDTESCCSASCHSLSSAAQLAAAQLAVTWRRPGGSAKNKESRVHSKLWRLSVQAPNPQKELLTYTMHACRRHALLLSRLQVQITQDSEGQAREGPERVSSLAPPCCVPAQLIGLLPLLRKPDVGSFAIKMLGGREAASCARAT